MGGQEIQRKEAQTPPQQNTKKAQRRCKKFKGGSQEIRRKPKEDSKENQRRLTQESKEAQKESKRKEAVWKLKAQESMKGDRKKGERTFKRGSKEAQEGPQNYKKLVRRKRADFEQEGGTRKAIDGQVPGREIDFQRWFPKVEQLQIYYVVDNDKKTNPMYDGTSTAKTNDSLSASIISACAGVWMEHRPNPKNSLKAKK